MLSSITPLGERGRRNRWGTTVTAFAVGSTAGGAVAGGLAGAVGLVVARAVHPSPLALAGVAAAACLLALGVDLRRSGSPSPGVRRQVDEEWLDRYRGVVYGLGFGAQLGAAVVTVVTTAAIYAGLVLVAVTGSVPLGAGLGAWFGLVRALPVVASGGVRSPEALRDARHRLLRLKEPVRRLTASTLGVTGAVAMGCALWIALR